MAEKKEEELLAIDSTGCKEILEKVSPKLPNGKPLWKPKFYSYQIDQDGWRSKFVDIYLGEFGFFLGEFNAIARELNSSHLITRPDFWIWTTTSDEIAIMLDITDSYEYWKPREKEKREFEYEPAIMVVPPETPEVRRRRREYIMMWRELIRQG